MKNLLLLACLSFSFIDSKMNAQGGPDSFGYTWISSNDPGGPTMNWIDVPSLIGAVQDTTLLDDNFTTVALGFDFLYYTKNYSGVQIGSNGWLGMPYYTQVSNLAGCFPAMPSVGGQGDAIVAPFMTDLILGPGGGNQGSVWYWTNGLNTFVISYINVPWRRRGSPGYAGSNTFQVIFSDVDSSITFQYLNMDTANYINDPSCAGDLRVGIESTNGNAGFEILTETMPQDSFVVRFSTPNNITALVDGSTNGSQAVCLGCGTTWDGTANFFLTGTTLDMYYGISNVGNAGFTTGYTAHGYVRNLAMSTLWTGTRTINNPLLGASTSTLFQFLTHPTITTAGEYYYDSNFTSTSDTTLFDNDYTSEFELVNCVGDSMSLSYATGSTPTNGFSRGAGYGAGISIVPPIFPATITSVDYFILDYDSSGTSNSTAGFDAVIMELDTVLTWGPGAIVMSATVAPQNIIENGWNRVTFPTSYTVNNYQFYAAILFDGDSIAIGTTSNGPPSRHTYEIEPGAWDNFGFSQSQDFLIRVNVQATCGVGIVEPGVPAVSAMRLYPNPSSDISTLSFQTVSTGLVNVTVTNLLGETVLSKALGELTPGGYNFSIDTKQLDAGIYLVSLQINNEIKTIKLIVQ